MFKKYFGDDECEKKESFFSAMNHDDINLGQTVKEYKYVEEQCQYIIEQLIQVAA